MQKTTEGIIDKGKNYLFIKNKHLEKFFERRRPEFEQYLQEFRQANRDKRARDLQEQLQR
jgi:hypothetical protein